MLELRSTHTSPETTTSDDSDGTVVESPTSPTPTQSLLGEGDLDAEKGHSQPSVGTLPLTEKDPPEKPEDRDPPPSSSVEGLDTEAHDKDESITPSSPGSSDKTEETPTYPIGTRISTEYSPRDTSLKDPFSSFWSGNLGDVSDQSGRKHRWLIRKPKRRHSLELEVSSDKDPRSYQYESKRDGPLLPRQRFYSSHLDAKDITFQQATFTLRYIVQQRLQEKQLEELEKEEREREKRRQLEVQHDIINRPRRLIPVEPILSPFEIEGKKVPGEDPFIPQLPFEKSKTKSKTLENPLIPRNPRPHKDSTSSESSVDTGPDSDMAATGATKDLIEALTKTLKNINQSPTIPLPVFKGKKGEDPKDHILKVEDYFGLHQIDDQQDKIKRFKDTLFETARKWAQTLKYTEEVVKFDYDPAIEDDKKSSMKYLFLRRFAKEGRTLEAAYSAWGSLTFDPNKDDIEQFIQKVEELAKKLGYNEDAQVMAVKSVLPRDVYGICMTYKTLKELKTFLIDLFANPKMREAVPGTASISGEPGVFSIGQHVENKVVNPTIADVSKIHQDVNALQVRFNKISSADFRSKTSKPWKPEVTPPKRRGGFNRGRGGKQYKDAYRIDRFKNENDGQSRDTSQRDNAGNFRNRGQGRGRFKSNFRGKSRGRGGFDKSPNVRRPRVASKTVDKDKMRCHYCNEFGHFIRECSKKTRDEKKTGQFNGMSMDYYGDDLYTWEDYDDEVFATLNS